jgi:predicted transcriptional regulator YdeE
MEPDIVEKDRMTLVGMVYYGRIGGEGWSEENMIGQLWSRFNRFCETKWSLIEEHVLNPKVGFEVTIWNEQELQETKCITVFVGVEVDQLKEMPLELVAKSLPAGTYAHLTPQGEQIETWEKALYDEWLPQSGYRLASYADVHFQMLAYEEGRFKGVGDLLAESEIDVTVPLVK